MMIVRRNTRKETNGFDIIVELSDGEHLFTARVAKELRDKLSSVLAEIKKEGKE